MMAEDKNKNSKFSPTGNFKPEDAPPYEDSLQCMRCGFCLPTCPTGAILKRKSDGIVEWRACIDHRSPNVDHFRVRTTHIGLGFSPDVLGIVAATLAESAARTA